MFHRNVNPQLQFRAKTKADWEIWKGDLKAKLIELLGGFPQDRGSLKPEVLSVRVNPLINADKSGLIENAYGGVNEKEIWESECPGCDYSGSVEGEKVGLAIFVHPANFRYPTYWHIRNYGLMTVNPFALSYYYNDPGRNGS